MTSGSKTAAALTARIDGHILAHHPALGAAAPGAVNPSVIGFIGPPVPAVAASAAPAQAVGRGPPAYVAPHPGAAGPAILGDDTGGFASALLAPPQVHALLALPTGELQKLLDAAGAPHSAAHTGADLRSKCAAAAWAAEKLRSIDDVRTRDGDFRPAYSPCSRCQPHGSQKPDYMQ